MKIWIDFANSPHVLFFQPIINKLNEQDHEIIISMRDFSQTVELAKNFGIEGTLIGKHSGRGILRKSWNIFSRAIKLWRLYKGEKIDIALSHNSYSQIIAGRLLGIRTVTIMDYEGQPANHIAFRLAHKILVPEYFPDESLKNFGAHFGKTFKFKGFKEQLYLSNCSVNDKFINELKTTCNLNTDWNIKKTTLVIIRPPAFTALYHRFENPLFYELLNRLKKTKGITVLLLPRTQKQENEIKKKYTFIKIPKKPIDGFNLLNVSDLVISAGGTMNREAAILGIPAYTIFAGSLSAVDQKLIEIGRMKSILSKDDFSKIIFEKKKGLNILKNENLLNEIIQNILLYDSYSDSRFYLYYYIRPFIPRNFQIILRRIIINLKRDYNKTTWPIDRNAGKLPYGWKGWPEEKKFALVITHDVESSKGLKNINNVIEVEKTMGFHSSFNFVPLRYELTKEVQNYLTNNGFEIGVHGLIHDGKLYNSEKIFKKRATQINKYLQEWGAVGFRAPSMHHNLRWHSMLNIEYDLSTFDTDPFEPQSDGIYSIFPVKIEYSFPIHTEYIEIPYTLPQDFSLFVLMKEKNINIWKRKLDWITEIGGMALINVHPDYMNFSDRKCKIDEYPYEYYKEFLEYIKMNYENKYWQPLPKEIAQFWKKNYTK